MNLIPTPSRGILFAALILWGVAARAIPPQKVTLEYDLSRNGSVVGSVVETIEHDGKTYRISSETRGRGLFAPLGVLLRRASRGNITPQGLQPVEFREKRFGKPETIAKFDWGGRTLTQERDGKSETQPMPAAPQDELSMAYSFAFALPRGKDIQVTRVNGRGLTPFRFIIVGTEILPTPMGEIQALHLSKQRDGPDDKATDIWFASGRNYLPVRVLVVDKDGTRDDQFVTHVAP
ncbi:MAG: DUF3108 domain-containing protein [Burkholderiales bacterium]